MGLAVGYRARASFFVEASLYGLVGYMLPYECSGPGLKSCYFLSSKFNQFSKVVRSGTVHGSLATSNDFVLRQLHGRITYNVLV